MPRILTDQPSPGKPLQLFIPTATNSGFVPTTWTTLVEAPDFSVPSSSDEGAEPDPLESDRELKPGEVYFETPLTVVNNSASTCWIEVRIQLQGTNGQTIPVTPQLPVPPKEAIYPAIQGLRVLKTDLTNSEPGGRLQVRAQVGNALTVLGSAIELEAQTHAPDSEAA